MPLLEVVADNAQPQDVGPEPDGFWGPIHEQVDAWIGQYGDDDTD